MRRVAVTDLLGKVRNTVELLLPKLAAGADLLRDFWSEYGPQIAAGILAFEANTARLPQDIQDESKLLAERGWYMDPHFPLASLRTLVADFECGRAREIDEQLVEYYRNLQPWTEERLLRKYPHRSAAMEQAFEAHTSGKYYLSIPVLLAQADGICVDLLGSKLFQKVH